MSDQPRVSKVFDFIPRPNEVNVMPLLASFVSKRHNIGMTEEQIKKDSGLGENALGEVAKLEKDGFVRSFICQEGTCGPYARRYKLVEGIEIKLEISRPA